MEETAFEMRLRGAVQAGWRTLLIGAAFITLLWLIHLAILSNHPAWFVGFWGPSVTWSDVTKVSLWAIAVLKIGLYIQGFLVLWGALWLSQLRKLRASVKEQHVVEDDSERPVAAAPSLAMR